MLSIPFFINFFPNSELKAFVPRLKPALARFEASPFPNCADCAAFLLAFIFLNAGAAKFNNSWTNCSLSGYTYVYREFSSYYSLPF